MAKVILLCGKICSGKTTYAEKLIRERHAVNLSVDEIMLSVFGQYAGDRHDEYTRNIQAYLFEKSLEILAAGADVILDWGFWTHTARADAKKFYTDRGISCELLCLRVTDGVWHERIAARNRAIEAGRTDAYYIDENLAEKFASLFEPPHDEEIDGYIDE